jgi:hypothetical protein
MMRIRSPNPEKSEFLSHELNYYLTIQVALYSEFPRQEVKWTDNIRKVQDLIKILQSSVQHKQIIFHFVPHTSACLLGQYTTIPHVFCQHCRQKSAEFQISTQRCQRGQTVGKEKTKVRLPNELVDSMTLCLQQINGIILAKKRLIELVLIMMQQRSHSPRSIFKRETPLPS